MHITLCWKFFFFLDIIRYLEIDPLYGRAMYMKNNTSNFTCILPTTLKITERQCDSFEIHLMVIFFFFYFIFSLYILIKFIINSRNIITDFRTIYKMIWIIVKIVKLSRRKPLMGLLMNLI